MLKNFSVILFLLVFISNSFAQTEQPATGEMNMDAYMMFLFIIMIIILNAIFIPLMTTRESSVTAGESAVEKKKTQIQIIKEKLTGLQPIETESSLLLEDNYDGIQELNNNVPPWFNILFYGTIVIAILYLLNYHVFKIGKLPFQEYYDEVYAADMKREELIRTGAFVNENTVELLKDNESLKTGKQIFMGNCVPCHGEGGQGTVGPNLTDEFWIHGGGIKNIFKTIKYGVPAKGMITWMNQFNPKMMQQVASYVISIQGTNPPGGKPPEGDKFIESVSDSVKSNTDSTKKDSLKKDIPKTDSTKKDSIKKDIMKIDSANVKK